MVSKPLKLLWLGRTGAYGEDYPRNRTIIAELKKLDIEVVVFQPRISWLADIEAQLRRLPSVDLIWVPCFRQRDMAAAVRYARRVGVPILFDPLISAFDKRVNEKRKYTADSWRGQRLLKWERGLFNAADRLVADTQAHKDYFHHTHGVALDNIIVLPVSAEETLFFPGSENYTAPAVPEALFFGSFIGLQGAEFIARAVEFYQGQPLKLTLLGDGPERPACERLLAQCNNPNISVNFEDWIPFGELPDRIRSADIALGIFGVGEKSSRVIPNKAYQSLACGLPLITMRSDAYPADLGQEQGLFFVPPGDPQAIAEALAACSAKLDYTLRDATAHTYQRYFSSQQIGAALSATMAELDVK